MKKILYTLIICALFACNSQPKHPQIVIETALGEIVLEIYQDAAPITANNFLMLVDSNEFKDATFYRTVTLNNQPANDVKIEVIQGGLSFTKDLSDFTLIEHETTEQTGILHLDGVISMARNQPGSACTEFFICVGDQPSLDFNGARNPDLQGFSAFGKVIKGMDIVRLIQVQPEEKQLLKPRIPIQNIRRF